MKSACGPAWAAARAGSARRRWCASSPNILGVPLSEVRKSSADAPITFGPTKSGEVQA
ncbi:MAG: hypothetical protein ACLUNO_05170 [Oscillospiraceae bacterium]